MIYFGNFIFTRGNNLKIIELKIMENIKFYIILFTLLLNTTSCKNDNFYIYDLYENKYSLNDVCKLKNNAVFVVNDFVSCHNCFINLSKFLIDSSYIFENSEIILLGLTTNNSVSQKKLYIKAFNKFLEKYSLNTYFIEPNNNFILNNFKELYLPSLLIWLKNENRFILIPYKELFDKETSEINEKAILKLKGIIQNN